MKTIIGSALLIALTGCAGTMHVADNGATLTGSPEGLQAMFDGLNGVIENTRIPAGQKSSHWQLRENQELQKTARENKPGFFSGMFSKNK
jgi:hypothetical protein